MSVNATDAGGSGLARCVSPTVPALGPVDAVRCTSTDGHWIRRPVGRPYVFQVMDGDGNTELGDQYWRHHHAHGRLPRPERVRPWSLRTASRRPTSTSVQLTLVATDGGSGLSRMRFSNDDDTWSGLAAVLPRWRTGTRDEVSGDQDRLRAIQGQRG